MGKDSRDLPGQALLDAAWFDPIEVMIRDRVRGFVEDLVEAELDDALGRSRYQRPGTANVASGTAGYRHGRRARQLLGSFGAVTIQVPRARLNDGHGTSREWRSEALPRYARMTRQVEALIAGTYLSGTNTRRVRRALGALFKGAVGKDVVSRTWRKVQTDWQAWCRRSLADEDVVRLILDGTVVRVRLDGKTTSISLLVALGIRRDGQKILLAVRNMGGERARLPGAVCLTIWSRVVCKYRALSSSMVRQDWRRPLAWCGPRHWSSGAPSTNTATFWLMLQNDCMRKSRPTTTT
jgi:transposase-like protein